MTKTIQFTITSPPEITRLDLYLAETIKDYSRSYFQFLIKKGLILVNGLTVKKRHTLTCNDQIQITYEELPQIKAFAQNIPLDILYEDDHLICVNKPHNMVVHPAPGHSEGTFVHALLYHCNQLVSNDPIRPGIVHRLDKDTSGVLLAAKTPVAHAKLVDMFKHRQMHKTYIAITHSRPTIAKTINAPIARHPKQRKLFDVSYDKGREAITHITHLHSTHTHSVLQVNPITGRTHQIRVHLKYLGAPILGDPLYGTKKDPLNHRLLLHAYMLEFTHPISNKQLSFKAPLPDSMKKYLEK